MMQLPSISSLLSDLYHPPTQPTGASAASMLLTTTMEDSKIYPNNSYHFHRNPTSTTTVSCTAIPTTNNFNHHNNNNNNRHHYYTSNNMMTTASPSSMRPTANSATRYSSLFSIYPTQNIEHAQPFRENSIWEGTVKPTSLIYPPPTTTTLITVTSPSSSSIQKQPPILPNLACQRVPIACSTKTIPPTGITTTINHGSRNHMIPNTSNVLVDESGFSHSSNVSLIGNDVKSNSSRSFENSSLSASSNDETTTTTSAVCIKTRTTNKKPTTRIATTTSNGTTTITTSSNVEVLKKVASACIKNRTGSDNSDDDNTEEEEQHNIPTDYSKQKIGKLRLKTSVKGDLAAKNKNGSSKGWWTEEEHHRFLEGLEACGNNWKLIAEKYVKTRSRTQVASHGQKWKQSQGLIA